MNEAALLLLIEIVWEHFYSKNSALQKWIVVQTSTNVVSMCLNNTQDLFVVEEYRYKLWTICVIAIATDNSIHYC